MVWHLILFLLGFLAGMTATAFFVVYIAADLTGRKE